jgi:Holliday junction resolvase RusA-like endonuclease
MNELRFHIPGPVIGKMRARVGTIAGKARMFTPAKTKNYEDTIREYAREAMGQRATIEGPCQCNLLVGVEVPASWSAKKRQAALQGLTAPTGKPDLDNCIKSAMDAMNGVVWRDDAQCVTLIAKKRYREKAGLWIAVVDLVGAEVQRQQGLIPLGAMSLGNVIISPSEVPF